MSAANGDWSQRGSEATTVAPPALCRATSAQNPIDVSVISVSYQCRDELLGMLDSLEEFPSAYQISIHVADNASTDGTEDLVREQFPEVDWEQIGFNSGFARANNEAIVRSQGKYVFLLNPDARVTSGCVDVLVAFMDANPDIAAVGPKLLNRDLSLQYSIRNFPTLRGSFLEALFLHHVWPRLSSRYGEMVLDESAYQSAHPVEWVSGAAMFVRRSVLDQVGLLDESFFLFSEEVDWFKRMNDLNLLVWFVPDAVVVHRDAQRVWKPELMSIDVESRRRYWRKHASRPRAAAATTLLALNLSLRYLLWSLISLVGSKTASRQRFAFCSGLRALAHGERSRRVQPLDDRRCESSGE